jgi:DNA-binding SARP family transcriptional activator
LVVSLFGPVRGRLGDRELRLGPPQQRAVLALLASRGNKTISRAELVDGIWGGEPPASAVSAVHVYVCGLRRAVEPNRAPRTAPRIQTAAGPGYLLRLEPDALDAEVFCRHLAAARASRTAGDLPAALGALDAGLALWLEPLLGIPGPWAQIERSRLGELRLTALEDRAEIMLETGRHIETATQLAALTCEHPLRERLCSALMLALYRSGRRADALNAYAETRRVLVAELGVEPGAALQRLHARILTADSALDPVPGRAAAVVAAARPPVPAQLPSDVRAFTGRTDEIAELDRLLAAAGAENTPEVLIIAVSGSVGVGKTALAVRWARRSMHRFADGQLFVDLRGDDPGRPAVPAAQALTGFLRTLGMAQRDIPQDVGQRAAAFRSMLAGRRMLIMLDNAGAAQQIHALPRAARRAWCW